MAILLGMTRKEHPRPLSFRVPLSEEEQKQLHALRDHTGIDAATMVRTWIRTEYAKLGAKAPKKGTK